MARNDWTSPDLAEIVSSAYALAHCHEQKFPTVVNLFSFSSYLMGKWMHGRCGSPWTHHQRTRPVRS
nr:hypothetical protein [Candidatus Sigynarchaeota archaeon]